MHFSLVARFLVDLERGRDGDDFVAVFTDGGGVGAGAGISFDSRRERQAVTARSAMELYFIAAYRLKLENL